MFIQTSMQLPNTYLDLLTNKRAFAHLATLMADGTPQVTPVWIDFDGTHVLVNTARGRLKDKNMRARTQVGIEVQDPENPYRYLSIQGRIEQVTEEGADEHIDKMALKYLGQQKYPHRQPGEVRVLYKILPLKAHGQG